jgi:hypothetical protein
MAVPRLKLPALKFAAHTVLLGAVGDTEWAVF